MLYFNTETRCEWDTIAPNVDIVTAVFVFVDQ